MSASSTEQDHHHPGTGTGGPPAGTGSGGPVRNGVGLSRRSRAGRDASSAASTAAEDHLALKRTTLTRHNKRMERALSRDAGSLRRGLPTSSEDSFPTALPMLLSMVQGADRLPADEGSQEVLRGKLRLLEADSVEVTALFTELSAHLLSINCDENVMFVTFKTFEEIWKFTTYCTLGFVGQCMESLLLDQEFWLDSVDEDKAVGMEVSIQEDTMSLMYQGLLMQEGSLFASCTANQMFDSSTFGGDLYLEQGDIAQFEPPFLGSGWTVHCLGDGARGTKPNPTLEPVVPFYQWFLKSCPENILVGGGKPACEFALQFARGRCVASADYDAEGPDELTVASGDDIIIVGLLVSCFDWFVGRLEATGEVGLVRTGLVKPSNDICESADIFLDEEEREFFRLREEQVIEETVDLLKKTAQIDVGYIYKLDPSNQQDPDKKAAQNGSSPGQDDAEPPADLQRNILRILNQGKDPPSSCTVAKTDPTRGGGEDPEVPEAAAPAPAPRFTVHPVVEGGDNNNAEHFAPLLAFLDGSDCKPEFGALYGLTPELLASSAFVGQADEDELAAFLGAAREAARKKRLYWSQSRLCFLLGKLCAGRSKFSQARVYLEEALSVPRDGFADMRLLASVYAGLAAVYLVQKNGEKYFALAERVGALLMGFPYCAESVATKDSEVMKYALKKAVLSHNAMAEARACYLLAKLHLRRGEGGAAEAAGAVPFIERLLVLSTPHSTEEAAGPGGGSVSPSHGYLLLGRLYRELGLPQLSFSSSRQASLHPSARLSDCLSALALVLQNTDFYGPIFRTKKDGSSIPAQVAPYLSRALSFTQEPATPTTTALNGPGGQDQQHQHHGLSQAVTLCLSQLFHKHGMVGHAVRSMHALVSRSPPQSSQSLAPVPAAPERNSALVWLAWLHVCDGRPETAVEILDAILAAMPEHCTTPQEGVVLNMRGVALRRMGDLRRAAESYQSAIDICEEFEDRHNWAVALANLGMLCLKAGAKRLAETHLLGAVEIFSELDREENHHEENFITVLLELGQHYVDQGNPHNAKGCLEWALLLSVYADHAVCQLSATRRLCHLYGEVSADRALGQCILYNEHLVNLLQRHGDRGQEGHALETISQLYLSLGTPRGYRMALDYTKRSLGIFIDLGRKEKEAYGWLQAGRIYHMLGQTELVDLYVQVAQDMGLGTGNTSFILGLLEAAGDVFFNSSHDREKAVCFYRDRALPIAVKTGSTRTRLRMCNKLTELLLGLKMYGEALEYAQTALDLSVTLGERLNERVAYHRLATLNHRLGQFELAEHYFLKTLALCPAPLQFDEETLYYARVYQTLGDIIFYDLKDPFDAAGYYHLALAAAMDLGNKRSQLELCTRLATIYHNFLLDRTLSLFFYQKARGFAADLNVRRVNIAPPEDHHQGSPGSDTATSQYRRTSVEERKRSREEKRHFNDQD